MLVGACRLDAGLPAPGIRGDWVDLVFAWPDVVAADVAVARTRLRPGESEKKTTASRYRLTAERNAHGYRVVYAPGARAVEGADTAEAQLAARLGALGTLRLGADGTYLDLVDADAASRSLRTELEGQFASLPEPIRSRTRRRMGPILERATSVRALDGRARERWQMLVGGWLGARLEIGETYERASMMPAVMLGGIEMRVRERFGARERVGCVEGGADRECILLELTMASMPEDATRAAAEFAASLGLGRLGAARIRKLETVTTVELVTDPATLLPQRLVEERHVAFEVQAGHDVVRRVEWRKRTAVYTYR